MRGGGLAIQLSQIRYLALDVLELVKHTIRAGRIAATDQRLPRPLRLLAAVGVLPIPGPVDEAALLIAAVPLALFYREELTDAWRRSASSG